MGEGGRRGVVSLLKSNVLSRGYLWYQVPSGGIHGKWDTMGYGRKAGGTHPTGMLSYYRGSQHQSVFLSQKILVSGEKKKFNVNLDPSMTFTFISHMYRIE